MFYIYWDQQGERFSNNGMCRINPPVYSGSESDPDSLTGYWPWTTGDDWCGAFKRWQPEE